MLKRLTTVAIIGGIGAAITLSTPFMFKACSEDLPMTRLQECPAAVNLLGDDIDVTMGIGCGSVETGGMRSHADVSIPVAGSKASGTYRYVYDRVGGHIRYDGMLEVDDVTLDIRTCRELAP